MNERELEILNRKIELTEKYHSLGVVEVRSKCKDCERPVFDHDKLCLYCRKDKP